jgi:bacterioferritin-associated ferredoxin
MDQSVQLEIIDKLTKTCICKGISRASIKKTIHNGAKTVKEVQQQTGAGTGSCCGRRCTPKIEELLKEVSNNL